MPMGMAMATAISATAVVPNNNPATPMTTCVVFVLQAVVVKKLPAGVGPGVAALPEQEDADQGEQYENGEPRPERDQVEEAVCPTRRVDNDAAGASGTRCTDRRGYGHARLGRLGRTTTSRHARSRRQDLSSRNGWPGIFCFRISHASRLRTPSSPIRTLARAL